MQIPASSITAGTWTRIYNTTSALAAGVYIMTASVSFSVAGTQGGICITTSSTGTPTEPMQQVAASILAYTNLQTTRIVSITTASTFYVAVKHSALQTTNTANSYFEYVKIA